MNKIEWCIDQHKKTNHWYDEYLPYEFHLRMVAQASRDFEHLLDDTRDYFTGTEFTGHRLPFQVTLRTACSIAAWGHDLIEDTRASYNDVNTSEKKLQILSTQYLMRKERIVSKEQTISTTKEFEIHPELYLLSYVTVSQTFNILK